MKTIEALVIKTLLPCGGAVIVFVLLFLNASRVWADLDPVNVAGYEAFPGLPCQSDDEDRTCGVRFYGWLGGEGAVPDGWLAYTGKGRVVVRINYVGQPGFGSQVTITDGTWRLADHGPLDSGTMTSGTVTWPTAEEDMGCGVGIATVEAALADGEFSRFTGCLHDFDVNDGVAIPPKIWGTFQ